MRILAAIVVAAACSAACGGSAARRGGGGASQLPMAAPGEDAVVDDAWGVGLLIDPIVTGTAIDEARFTVETVLSGNLGQGVFAFTIALEPERAAAGSAVLAAAAREELSKDGGSELSEVSDISFLGRPGHAFTFRDDDAYGLQVSMVTGKCVFDLVVLRSGRPEWMTQYASTVLRNIKPLTGGPVDPPRCR
jgi:hypothetical protein